MLCLIIAEVFQPVRN